MAESEEIIVINDLLSFLSCKIKQFSKERIEESLSEFYPNSAIIEAEKTLIASLSDGDTSKYLKRKKDKDPFKNLFNIFGIVPNSELPIFVCKNLNNVPKLENEDTNDNEDIDNDVDELVTEQKFIKNQIAEISSVVYQLKDQIQLLAKHRTKNKDNNSDFNEDMQRAKENGTFPSKNNKNFHKDNKLAVKSNLRESSKANGLAYLQKLIDEDEQEKKFKMKPDEERYANYDEMNENCEEAENLIQLMANRQQRASVKIVEAEVLSGNRKKVHKRIRATAKRKFDSSIGSSSDPSTNKLQNICNEELFSDMDEDEIELHLQNDDFDGIDDFVEEDDDADVTIIKKPKESRNHIVTEEVDDENIGKLTIHKCTLCNFTTNDESTINRHECPQIHGGSGVVNDEVRTFKYFCLECKFRSNNLSLHERHRERHPQYFSCPFCEEKYEDPEDWTDHALQCIRDGDFKQEDHICAVCNVIYATASALRLHRGNHDLNRQFECLVCRFRFRTEERLETHMRIHNSRGFRCPFCTYVHKNKYTFLTHVRSHTGETPFTCELCDYKCTSSSAIAAHMLCHSSIRDKKCNECPAHFKSIQKLKSHKRIHRKGVEFRCPECRESYPTAWLMTVHHNGMHVDPLLRTLSCPLCPFTCDVKGEFRAHVQLHENVTNFQCSLCDFSGYEKDMLVAHMKQDHLMLGV